jgi:predicted P-loop ATPase
LEALARSIVSSEALKERTEAYRAALKEDKDRAAEMKKEFPGFLPAAHVQGRRKREFVTGLTGLVMCDFDHIPAEALPEIRTKVNADPHTVLSYVTLSGEGLRILSAYLDESAPAQAGDKFDWSQAERHYRRMFQAVNEHYARLVGQDFDEACKDLTRLSFAAYDPQGYYHPEARPFQAKEVGVLTEAARKQKRAEKKQQNKRLFPIEKIYQKVIRPQLEADGETFGPGTHNRYVMRVGYLLNKYGFDLPDAQEWARKTFAEYAEAAEVMARCYTRSEEHGEWSDRVEGIMSMGRNRFPKANRMDIYNFLMKKVEVRRNVLLGLSEMRWKNPEYMGIASKHSQDRHAFTHDIDAMVKTLTLMLEEDCQLDASKERFFDVIENDRIPEFDPLADYLHHLPHWEAGRDPDYLQELADTVTIMDANPGAQDLWTRCLKKWFVWMLVGWTRPDEVNQTILHLIGAQGTYKSTWMRHLMPPTLRGYFKIKQNSGEIRTDDLINMSRFGLILHEESDVMNARESNTLKAMVTASHSDERAPYGRAPHRRHNCASLCATGNVEQFLSNEQGTRRSLVFRVQSIVSPVDHPFNYEGIYSQAYSLMQHDFPYYFSPEEQAELELHNLQFETANMEEDAAGLWLRKPESWETPEWMRPSEIANLLSQRSGCHARYDANKIGTVMKRLKFESTYHTGRIGYKVMVRNYDEAVRYRKQLAVNKDGDDHTPLVKDISEAPEQAQNLFNRLWGEKDEED